MQNQWVYLKLRKLHKTRLASIPSFLTKRSRDILLQPRRRAARGHSDFNFIGNPGRDSIGDANPVLT